MSQCLSGDDETLTFISNAHVNLLNIANANRKMNNLLRLEDKEQQPDTLTTVGLRVKQNFKLNEFDSRRTLNQGITIIVGLRNLV